MRWNVFGQRWYVTVQAEDGTRVVTLPFIASPSPRQLENVTNSVPVSTMAWTATGGGTMFVETALPNTFPLGAFVNVSGATNTGTGSDTVVNGNFVINAVADTTHFTVVLPAGPGVVGSIGGNPLASRTASALNWASGVVTAKTGTGAASAVAPVGQLVNLTIARCSPDAYNGRFLCAVTNDDEFTYQLAANPGRALILGTFSPDINMLSGYFETSSMVWREKDSRFEVNP